jgi:hypothetical protein
MYPISLGDVAMSTLKTKFGYVTLIVGIAVITGYLCQGLGSGKVLGNMGMTWLVTANVVLSIIGAYVLGERQAQAAWESVLGSAESRVEKAEAALMRIATAAHSAIELLDDRYRDTHQDRMRLRVVYFADTFSTLIEALSAIPVHELTSVEAVIALVGLRKNMTEAQLLIERYVADQTVRHDSAMTGKGLDLRACKAHASSHYHELVRALKTD